MRRLRPSASALLGLALAALGCGGGGRPSDTGSPDAAASGGGPPAADGGVREVASLVDMLPDCDIHHRGLIVDLGTDETTGRFGWRIAAPENLTTVEHDGATWARIYDRSLSLQVLVAESTPVFVAARVVGRDSKSAAVLVDGVDVGVLSFGKGDIKVASTHATQVPLSAGLHLLELRFRGREKAGSDPFAEVDWVRLGVPGDNEGTYGAATLGDVRNPSAVLGGEPHRAIALRAPASVRCGLRIPEGGRVRVAVGMQGDGKAEAEIAVRVDGESRSVLQEVEVEGGAQAEWSNLEVPLSDYGGRVVSVELAAVKTTGTGRLMFGDPALVVPAVQQPVTPLARIVVVVVLDGIERGDLPPYAGHETPNLAALVELGRTAVVFDEHRGDATLVATAMASLLSGVSPLRHGLLDALARLPAAQPLLAQLAGDASVRAAFYSGVPSTFAPFGFARGWDPYVAFPPHGERLATAPLDDAAAWITQAAKGASGPLLVVVHARGGHPPWEVTPKEAATLPPADYAGPLNPRTAAQVLWRVRAKKGLLEEKDRERLRALYHFGIADQDRALGRLVTALEEAGLWDSTMFVVTGDVASGRRTLFADGAELDEELLALPLYVHFPGGVHGPRRVDRPTEVYDVTRTIVGALGIKPGGDALGRDLASVALSPEQDVQMPRVALLEDRYSARWGDFALTGRWQERPRLCHLPVDPGCSFDWSRTRPLVVQTLFRRLVRYYARHHQGALARAPLEIDADTDATLKVWGAHD
ncbi:MAG: sulfatase-like hydrolase/transferase [Myxococcales bacterium]|nr:sulfatase-like hydrolase/transferase [Myxococcales bacterium]